MSASVLHLLVTPLALGLLAAVAFRVRLRSKPEMAIQGAAEWVSVAFAGVAVAVLLVLLKLILNT